ncbi:hypothetical protein WG66_005444, partial [Moniliophthora roreri]
MISAFTRLPPEIPMRNTDPYTSLVDCSIKIDILLYGEGSSLRIPYVPFLGSVTLEISGDHQVEVMPPFMLLLMKLKGWEDHRTSSEARFKQKVPNDIRDILNVKRIAAFHNDTARGCTNWLPGWFVRDGKNRAKAFLKSYPTTAFKYHLLDEWVLLGLFDTIHQASTVRERG